MSYDPKAHGAKCDICPLKGQTPVGPDLPYGGVGELAIVGEGPGEVEVQQGRAFVGPSGMELDKALKAAGIDRRKVLVTNVMNCRPPANAHGEANLKAFLDKLSRADKARWEKAQEKDPNAPFIQTPTPMECCRPRLEREIEGYSNFIALGKPANQALTGTTTGILGVRGSIVEVQAPPRRVMPTVHPAFVLRAQRWRHVFRNDLAKAVRIFRGQSTWKDPEIIYHPSPEELRRFLMAHEAYAYDVETDAIESLTAKLRCIAIGTEDVVHLVGVRSIDGQRTFYPHAVDVEIWRILKEFFEDDTVLKIAHNGAYDMTVLWNQKGIRVKNPRGVPSDTLLLHKSVESELPHNLGYVGSVYTDIDRAWKQESDGTKLAFGSQTDEQLHEYCGLDTTVTKRAYTPLLEHVRLRDQVDVCLIDHDMQIVCMEMHSNGMYVDQPKRASTEKELLKARHDVLGQIRGVLGKPNFNPGSIYQLRDLFFEQWKLTPNLPDEEKYTSSDDPSTSDLVLRALLTDPSVPKDKRDFIKLVRRFRKLQKVLGTYVAKMRYSTSVLEKDLGWDEDEDWIDRETRERYGTERTGIVDPRTGRMHPGYSLLPVTGRLSSSKPINAQNYPSDLRAIVTAAPGNVLVGADADQLELRIAAAWWQVELYLRAFREGKDPHSMTAFAVFGTAFCKAAGVDPDNFSRPGILIGSAYTDGVFDKKKASPEAIEMRSLAKAIQYASIARDEQVAVLDARRSIPIADIKPGDWTWSWSTKRKRYEPAKVLNAWNHGVKPCVKVTFSWNAPKNGGKQTGSMVMTADHPCLTRDGTFRHAGSLRPGDRLMPFSRGTEFGEYAALAVRNTGVRVGEHRVVMGFYDAGDRLTHVHHKDGNPLNNRPDNLEILKHDAHYAEHKEAVDEARRKSEVWRASVRDLETRSKASLKAWEGRYKRKDTDGNFGPRPSKLDAFKDKVGVLTDEAVAALAGCTASLVGMYRKEHDIPPPVGQKGWLKWLLTNDVLWRRLLCDHTDTELAKMINQEFGTDVDRASVKSTRKKLGIPTPVRNFRSDKGKHRASKLDPWSDRVGHEADAIISREAGVTPEAVAHFRKARGIPAYWKEAPGGTNHVVVSIEPVGEREVWDLEVDHEDHNFALSCGVFVHNSQYMGSVETVHKLIQKTEVPAIDKKTGKPFEDGTTDLPYAQMELKKVRGMRDKWLRGAPEFEWGWERDIQTYKHQGYLREPVHGRRRDFLDGEDANAIVNFSVQCVPGSTRVITSHGYVPIAELEGLTFLAWTGKKWAPATCVAKGEATLWEVRTTHALSLRCDASHGFKVPMRSDYEWKRADELICNQRVALAMATPLEFGRYVDPEDAYMLGLWTADGSSAIKKGERSMHVNFAVGDKSRSGPVDRCGQPQVDRILAWLSSRGLSGFVHEGEGCRQVVFYEDARTWCETWGLNPGWKARTKRIPERIWRADLEARKSFLRGVLDGDGYQHESSGAVNLHMCNPELLEELAVLFRSVGVDALSLRGPMKQGEFISYRLALAAAHTHAQLGWGRPAKYRSNNTAPQFECLRVHADLIPSTASHRTIKSRIRGHRGGASTSPYVLEEMGAIGLYDHATVTSSAEGKLRAQVYTLCVEDEDHQYVANGFIAKNSSAAGLMNRAIIELYEEIEKRKKAKNWGPNTGIINQCHDSIVIECPEDDAEWARKTLEGVMNQSHNRLPGVVFSSVAAIGKNWKQV